MPIPLDPNQLVSSEELPMFQVVQQEALTRLFVEKGVFRDGESGRSGDEDGKEGGRSIIDANH